MTVADDGPHNSQNEVRTGHILRSNRVAIILRMATIRYYCFLLVLLLVFGCNQPIELPPLSSRAVILAFGDSLTYGTGVTEEQAYPAILAKLLDRKVINAGVAGEVSADGLSRLPRLLNEYHPDLVVLVHGGNDMLQHNSDREIEHNLNAMLELIKNYGATTIMLGVPKPGLLLESASVYQKVASAQHVPIDVDVLANILSNKSLKSDTVHPNAPGYNIMAEALYSLLSEHGALKD